MHVITQKIKLHNLESLKAFLEPDINYPKITDYTLNSCNINNHKEMSSHAHNSSLKPFLSHFAIHAQHLNGIE